MTNNTTNCSVKLPSTTCNRVSSLSVCVPINPQESPINPHELKSCLGNLVFNSEPSLNQRFSVIELRDKLKKYQCSSQVKSCGLDLDILPVVRQSGRLIGTKSSCQSVHCPKCRIAIMSQRKNEIQFLIDSFLSDNPFGSIKMLTLTFPHYKKNRLSRILGTTKSRRGLRGAAALLKERHGWKTSPIFGYVQALEVTHSSKNGWHPHLHLLLFCTSDLNLDLIYQSWADACNHAGLPTPSREHGINLQDAQSAAEYMSKWSIASEAAGMHLKDSFSGRGLHQIEQSVLSTSNRSDELLLMNFHRVFNRARFHVFSKSLRSYRNQYLDTIPEDLPIFQLSVDDAHRLESDPDFMHLCSEYLKQDFVSVSLDTLTDLGFSPNKIQVPEVFYHESPANWIRARDRLYFQESDLEAALQAQERAELLYSLTLRDTTRSGSYVSQLISDRIQLFQLKNSNVLR